MRSTSTRASVLVGLFALVGTLLAAPVTAGPRPSVQPVVSLKAAETQVELGSRVVLRGAVKRAHRRPAIRVQRSIAGRKWTNVAKVRLTKAKRYRVAVRVPHRHTRFRVKVFKKLRFRPAVSRVLRVTGTVPAPDPIVPGPGPGPVAPDPSVDAAVQQILDDTNAFRAEHGRAPLVLHPELTRVAQAWSTHMAVHDVFEHNPDFADQYPPGWTAAGENIAAGQDLDEVVQAWIDSPGHRANLLADYTHLGVGIARDDASRYGVYYTQNFATYP